MSGKLIAPSILSADFTRLGEHVGEVERAGADWLHVDVMDGHFVPNLTIGPFIVEALKRATKLPLDCHLMVTEPEKWIGPFADAGAAGITVHAEAVMGLSAAEGEGEPDESPIHFLLRETRDRKLRAGVSISPPTSVSVIEAVLDHCDLVLVMSVHPGFAGQKFISSSLDKVKQLVQIREKRGLKFLIEIDGGIGASNIAECSKAGVDVFVAGSAVFGAKDGAAAVAELKKLVSSASSEKPK